MNACLIFSLELAAYDLGADHPLRPERVTLAVALMEAYGLLAPPDDPGPGVLDVIEPASAADDDLLLVHDADYVAVVKELSEHPSGAFLSRKGLGSADTPVFPGMHEASALVAGSTIRAIDEVFDAAHARAFSVAGGLHHAHRDRAAGFCIYNDAAIGIAHALQRRPDMRVLYVDIDAHHGDGVQETFYADPRVLTISLHETGMALYPGTGFADERGKAAGLGFSANVPMPPYATDACYRLAFEGAVVPLAREFAPDLIVAQCGADAQHDDPLTTLGLTVGGHAWLTRSIVSLADEVCGGRLVALGGGGYGWEHVVPRAWTLTAAAVADVDLPEPLPEVWRERVRAVAGVEPPNGLRADTFEVGPSVEEQLLAATRASVEGLMEAVER